MKSEGPLALYKGITPVLLRAFPANAACFVGFELCKQFLDFLFPKNAKTSPEQIKFEKEQKQNDNIVLLLKNFHCLNKSGYDLNIQV